MNLRRLLARPPALEPGYDMAAFMRFHLAELPLYTRRYARRRVRVRGQAAVNALPGGAVLVFLHYGCFFLIGGAAVLHLRQPFAAMVTGRNLTECMMSANEVAWWRWAHRHVERLYGERLRYTHESPRDTIQWLRAGGIMAMALDVREVGQVYREAALELLGQPVHFQLGPARVAQRTDVPLVPASIRYDRARRCHDLRFGEPIPVDDPVTATQRALDFCAQDLRADPAQQFHDVRAGFASPSPGSRPFCRRIETN